MFGNITRDRECGPNRPDTSRRRYPARTMHLIDIENVVGAAIPSLCQVRELRELYARRVGFGALDQVVLACNHLALLNAALGWSPARYRVRSGDDGADLELLDVLHHEHVVERFTQIVIASGDGAFAEVAADLAAAGGRVIVVSRRESLSTRLALAAHKVIYIGTVHPASAAVHQHHADAA